MVETEYLQQSTFCPMVATQCPECIPTVYPMMDTECPGAPTWCALAPVTICPLETTGCPDSTTFCPQVDYDGDEIAGNLDNCPGSNMEAEIIINGCHTGIENKLLDNGCSMSDLIAQCKKDGKNHGQFVRCVSHLVNDWKKSGLIPKRINGLIRRCAARANIR
jgi:hypothetical protein